MGGGAAGHWSFFVPTNGAVEGFAWSGFDANYNPTVQPPVYTFDQIVAATHHPCPCPNPARCCSWAAACGRSGIHSPSQVTVTVAPRKLHVHVCSATCSRIRFPMTRRMLLLPLLLTALCLLVGASVTHAQDGARHAGLVIRYGDGSVQTSACRSANRASPVRICCSARAWR